MVPITPLLVFAAVTLFINDSCDLSDLKKCSFPKNSALSLYELPLGMDATFIFRNPQRYIFRVKLENFD
jgi:hypothetical protein